MTDTVLDTMPDLATTTTEQIADLKAASRFRTPTDTTPKEGMEVVRRGKKLINFSSNDYFGLTHHPKVIKAAQDALDRYGVGSGASRLVTGNLPLTTTLEEKLADLRGTEAACVFGSGYMANLGIISALTYRNDLILCDKLAHASVLDAARLSGAKLMRFRHNDMAHLKQLLERHRDFFENCLIVTDAVFSMDGDLAPIDALSDLSKAHDSWLMTDDAHGWGTCGEALDGKAGKVDLQMGTLSKAVGTYGGYLCATKPVIDAVKSSARSLIYSTALPSSVLASALAALRIIQREDKRRAAPLAHAQAFTRALGLPLAQSPIVPIIVGDNRRALETAHQMEQEGFLVVPIRPPSVPEGTARLRFSFSAAHTDEQVEALIAAVKTLAII